VNERAAVAWLARRVGFGLEQSQLDVWSAAGVDAVLDRWMPVGARPRPPDPWAGLDLRVGRVAGANRNEQAREAIGSWLQAMVETDRPFDEWMRWFWHGHFVSTIRVVRSAPFMVQQLRMFGELGLGDFRTLLKAVTLDAAMLVYLNGNTNAAGAINENYGREVLELFALGVGNYTEADVRAGATALTGWVVAYADGQPRLAPRRHDDTPQHYLGRDGVHDVDTVVDAIVEHPACAPFITGKLASAILGPDVDAGLVASLSRRFAASGLEIAPLVRSIVEAGLDGASRPLVLAPVPWTVQMIRATGVPYDRALRPLAPALRGAGQVPLDAPNVGGWPGGPNWLTTSATLARFDFAGQLATRVPSSTPALVAAASGDVGALADALARPEGFPAPAVAALRDLPDDGARRGVSRLTLAMAAPDLAVA